MSQKQRKAAMISALSQVKDNVSVVADSEVISLDGKTKSMVQLLTTHKAYPKKALIVIKNGEQATSAKRASANLSQVTLMQVGSLSAYDVLNYPVVLFTTSALDELQKKLI